jgi:hypothetical protein
LGQHAADVLTVMRILIQGDGIAAYCCAHLLGAAGFQVATERADRARLPAIMLSDPTQRLFKDVFKQEDLFGDQPRIRKRVVAWGPQAEPLTLDHTAVVVSEQFLVETIRGRLPLDESREETPDWTIIASRLPAGSVEQSFGSRVATAVPVTLREGSDPEACWIESLEDGWLFLIPAARGSAWLLSVGSGSLLERSRMILGQIEGLGDPVGEFPAHPRMAWPLCGTGWLACGTAALAFDPLCGDGTGHALREAILASAVVRAAARGDGVDQLLAHYEARLLAGFRRHLAVCRDFYRSGRAGPWWDSELESLDRGMEWCAEQMRTRADLGHRLVGFELRSVSP